MKKVTSIVINNKFKIKDQLQISYSIIVIFSTFVTLGICLILLLFLVETSFDAAKSKITTQTIESVIAVSVEISNSLEQQMKIISENVVLNSVIFASILINYSNTSSVHGPILAPQNAYRDYNFVPGCQYPKCPSDYSHFSKKSRLPSKYVNGSVTHPSIYLYSGRHRRAVRNDSFWDQVVSESSEINNVVNGLVYQDNDFRINYDPIYTQNVSSMFYLTTQVENLLTATTNVVHRTFPGIRLRSRIVGDPTTADWFQQAPVNAVYLHGPYQEPLTNQLVIVMSSRKTADFPVGSTNQQFITFVSAGMMSLERLAEAVNSFQYTDSGFGAVVNSETSEVLVWRDSTHQVFDNTTNTFSVLSDFYAPLGDAVNAFSPEQRQQPQTITLIDVNGTEWLVSYMPFFESRLHGSDETYSALVLLVFSHLSEANSPLYTLKNRLDSDTNDIRLGAYVTIGVTIFVMIVLVCFTVRYITAPLPKLMSLSNDIIVMSTASEEDKDFSGILSDPLFALRREDEIGLLIGDYYQLLTVLQERSLLNRDQSQYPSNPFQIRDEDKSTPSTSSTSNRTIVSFDYTWQWFVDKMALKLNEDQRVAFAECTKKKTNKKVGFQNAMRTIKEGQGEDSPIDNHNTAKPQYRDKQGRKQSRVSPDEGGFDTIPEETSVASTSLNRQTVNNTSFKEETSFNINAESYNYEVSAKQESLKLNASSSNKHQLLDGATEDLVSEFSPEVEENPLSVKEETDNSRMTKRSKQSRNSEVSVRYSLRMQLMSLFALLLTACMVTMVFTLTRIQISGAEWSSETQRDLRVKVVQNLQAIAEAKSTFVSNYFHQLSTDTNTLARSFLDIVQGTALRPDWYNNTELYLPSYAMETHNPYSTGLQGTTNYSAYLSSNEAHCQLTSDNCARGHNAYNTRMTSLMDLKYRSLFRPGTDLTYIQIALEEDGTMRYLPYQRRSNLYNPTTCFHQDTTYSFCRDQWTNSSCNPVWINPQNHSVKFFPPYDARCRNWYQYSIRDSKNNLVAYQTPKVTIPAGDYILTAGVTIREHEDPNGQILGVVSTNFLITRLSLSISALDYMSDGYCYLVQAADTSVVVAHPKATSTCTTLLCVEDFSVAEYKTFQDRVLTPLSTLNDASVSSTYTKNGKQWQMVFARVTNLDVQFILIATLPVSVIQETSKKIDKSIDNTVDGMLIAFLFAIVIVAVLIVLFATELTNSIVNPVNELRKVFELVRMSEDLSGQVPEVASSQDMRVLLDAFSKLMIALRFSNESYAAGNQKRTREVFTDALSLYTGNNDKRGIGISLANLAASELARQRYDAAESLFKKAIDNAEEILADSTSQLSRADEIKMERLLSDRKGSFAMVYLLCDRLDDALAVLNPAMEIDLQNGNMIGYALKQCRIGSFYMKKQDFDTADRVFNDLRKLVRTHKRSRLSAVTSQVTTRISAEEIESAEQVALYRIAMLKKERQVESRLVESALLHAITKNNVMHVESTSKALIALKKIFAGQDRKKHIQQLNWLATEFNLNVDRDTSSGVFAQNITNGLQPPKRVMFCLDYSANMAGVALQATVDNVNTVFETHTNTGDSMSIVYFNHKIDFALPLTTKKGNELMILDRIERLAFPSGAQVIMYDAVMVSLYALSLGTTEHDWLILVTSSDDTASRLSLEKTMDMILFANVGLVVIGIGEGVQTAALELLAGSTKKGVYLHAEVDKKSINEAFDHAIQIIEMCCGEDTSG